MWYLQQIINDKCSISFIFTASTGWMEGGPIYLYCVSSMRLRTVFISFNNIFMSDLPILMLWLVSVGTPSTNSFFNLNVKQAQSMASLGMSYVTSISSFTKNMKRKMFVYKIGFTLSMTKQIDVFRAKFKLLRLMTVI